MQDRRLYLLMTRALCRLDPLRTAELAILGGVDAIQFREKSIDASSRAWLEQLLALCRGQGVLLLVNDDVQLAIAAGADGAHVGQTDLPVSLARQALGDRRFLGVSTHDVVQARRAMTDGADHIGVGPCYATTTKGYSDGLGPAAAGALAAAVTIPAFAIGGITPRRVPELVRHGIRRIAVSSAILAAADPQAAAAELSAALPT